MPSQAPQNVEILHQSLESLTRVLEGSQLGFWDWNLVTDEVKRNAIWAQMLGYSFDEIEFTTQQWSDFVHPDDRERAWESINAVLEGRASEHELTYRMKTKAGSYKWILDRARVVQRDADGKPLRMSGTHTDVDELKQTEAALQDSERRFRGIFENAGVGIAQMSLDGSFECVNDTYCRITGYSREELLQVKKNVQAITFPDDLSADQILIEQLVDGRSQGYDLEKRYVRKDGSLTWVHLSVSPLKDADGQLVSFISTVQEITKQKELQAELERQARIDYLTGIPNRRHFMALAEHELARAQRYANTLAIFMVDIDFFKTINDKHGHKTGDIVLQKVAQSMRNELRGVDVIGRLGGEEFAIILPHTNRERAFEVAQRLKQTIADTGITVDDGSVLTVTISIGLAMSMNIQDSVESLLNKADKGLYLAKAMGRNTIEMYG